MEDPTPKIDVADLNDEELTLECEKLKLSLPKGEFAGHIFCKYQQIWYHIHSLKAIICFQTVFQAQNTDIIIASKPKTGTTWLKSLVFAITNRSIYSNYQQNHPLLTSNPHQLVQDLEFFLYAKTPFPDFTKMSSPRLFATHVGYNTLPDSIKNSDCKIVYITRNPYDTFVSLFHFISFMPGTNENLVIEELFNKVCQGLEPCGPFYEHALGYWKQSLERPNKVLFLNYEDLKTEIVYELKKLAKFLGFPFTMEEENQGVIDKISKLCSFENLSTLEVNKTGELETKAKNKKLANKIFFRKGQVGDWVGYFTPSMVERFDALIKEKLGGSGLSYKSSF